MALTPKIKNKLNNALNNIKQVYSGPIKQALEFASKVEVGAILIDKKDVHYLTKDYVLYRVIERDDNGLTYLSRTNDEINEKILRLRCMQSEVIDEGAVFEYHPNYVDSILLNKKFDPHVIDRQRKKHIQEINAKNKPLEVESSHENKIDFFSQLKPGDRFYTWDDLIYDGPYKECIFERLIDNYVIYVDANQVTKITPTHYMTNLYINKPFSYSMVE
jgi:hypothetical protein